MACVRRRRGKYVVDWRDGVGVRHWRSFDRKRDAYPSVIKWDQKPVSD